MFNFDTGKIFKFKDTSDVLGELQEKKGASSEDRDVDSRTERKRSIGCEREGEGCLLQWRLEKVSG